MITLAFAFLFSVGLISISVWLNHKRAQNRPLIDLIPNCLLTSKPIVFITGRESLFYFGNYWNGLPRYLAEHGYEVYEASEAAIKKQHFDIHVIDQSFCSTLLASVHPPHRPSTKEYFEIALHRFFFALHRLLTGQRSLRMENLGLTTHAHWLAQAQKLLMTAQTLAEQDFHIRETSTEGNATDEHHSARSPNSL